jgi:hypothetical protein
MLVEDFLHVEPEHGLWRDRAVARSLSLQGLQYLQQWSLGNFWDCKGVTLP